MVRPLNRLLRPKSIAAIGGKEAKAVIQQCLALGYEGEIWPVHPTQKQVCGFKTYRDIDALPGSPDAAFIAVNRQRTIPIVDALSRRNAGGAICYASGFLETDEEGADLQQALIKAAGDMPIIGPNCYGLLNYANKVALWPDQHGGKALAKGDKGVAIITQSSNIAINMTMQKRGLPIAYVLTVGNQAQTGLSELADAVLDDPCVTALGLHIEGFDNIAGFEAVARKARALKKPIIAMKVGRSEQAQQAAYTHTASFAGSDVAADAFLRRIGIGRVKTIPSFLEALKLLHVSGPLEDAAISSMSCSGGEASLMSDACVGRKVYFPNLSEAQKKPLQEALGPMVAIDNPLDYHTYIWGDADGIRATFEGMLSVGFDLNCLVLDFPRDDRCQPDDWWISIDAFDAAARQTGANCAIIATLPENISEDQADNLVGRKITPLCGIEEALDAIEVAAMIGQAWLQPEPIPVMTLQDAVNQTCSLPDEADAKEILARYGVSVPRGQRCLSIDEIGHIATDIGFPVVIKALGLAHKTECNGVRLNICDEETARKAATELLRINKSVYVEAMVVDVVAELLVGVVRDEQFGLVMTIATGGVFVEVLQDSQTLLLPSSGPEIEQALRNLKGAVFFDGFRGGKKADIKAAVREIQSIQKCAIKNAGNLIEMDINPLIVCAEGRGAFAADALIKMGSENDE